MEIYQVMERKTGDRLADVGDEVILPIEFVHPFTGAKPRNGQALHYMVPFYYTVEQDGSVGSAFGFPPGMRGHTRFDRFEKLILDETIPADHPGVKNGRIALWTFETWVEFDNVKVTRLVLAN